MGSVIAAGKINSQREGGESPSWHSPETQSIVGWVDPGVIYDVSLLSLTLIWLRKGFPVRGLGGFEYVFLFQFWSNEWFVWWEKREKHDEPEDEY